VDAFAGYNRNLLYQVSHTVKPCRMTCCYNYDHLFITSYSFWPEQSQFLAVYLNGPLVVTLVAVYAK